jgi:hypothetical protein
MKQDESDADLKFITTIGFGGKLTSYWKSENKQFWKWRGVYKAYKNTILESNVGQTSFENKRKACEAHVISTIRSSTTDIWIGGLQRRHNLKRWFPRKKM